MNKLPRLTVLENQTLIECKKCIENEREGGGKEILV